MSSSSSVRRKNPAAGHRPRRTTSSSAAPKQEWVPRSSTTPSPSLVQELQDKLARGAVECTTCYDMVRRSSPIWSCSSCFSIFHLHCIRKWARSPPFISSGDWHCPTCHTPQSTPARDLSYTCFCGRCRDPPNDQCIASHSCGKRCGKRLDGEGEGIKCPHLCVLECHPGPCPPCNSFAPIRKCFCGKTDVVRRCFDGGVVLSCGRPCNRFLGCGRHVCERVCHEGACGDCKEVLAAKCFCGKREEEVICGDAAVKSGFFSCDNVCGRRLLCGNHVCKENCHPGLCGECELLPGKISACCCGKKKIFVERKSCLDSIPTCSEVCGKPLVCKNHFCEMRCHEGDCPPCSVRVQQRCQCGSSRLTVECYQLFDKSFSFMCEKTCCRKKSCGRHRCNERCCVLSKSGDWDPHLCSLPCGKKLRCGNHTCQLLCHGGHCSPCIETIFTDLTCACGKTSISPPIRCGTPLPLCTHLCLVPQPCGHPASHSCHFGDCPPCTVPVMKECIGGHVMLRNIPCCAKDIRCNQRCGQTRQCGIHVCAKTCHPTPCDACPAMESEAGVRSSCGQVCGAPRRDCEHTCTAPFHPFSSCPEERCEFAACGAGASSSSFSNDILLESSVIPELSVSLQPVYGDDRKVPLGQRKLSCDEECDKEADAFDVTLPNLDALHFDENLVTSEVFSDLMWRVPKRVIAIEERFKFMVMGKSIEGSRSSMKVHVFCRMLMEKRDALLQIAERWKLPVQTASWEPKRFLVVHVSPKSKPGVGLKPGFLMIAAYPPAFDPLIDMEPRRVVALLDLPRDADISFLVLRFGGEYELVWLNDKNSLAVSSDPARVASALQRLNHGFSYQGVVTVPQNVGVAAPAAAGCNVCGVDMLAGNPSNRIVALEMDSYEPGLTLGAEVVIHVWRGNDGNPVSENANQLNFLDADVVLESASDWEGSPQLEDGSIVESGVYRGITDMGGDQEVDNWEKSCE